MARQPRDYRAEYARRNELAKERGYRNYSQQRRVTRRTPSQPRRRPRWILIKGNAGIVSVENERSQWATRAEAEMSYENLALAGLEFMLAMTFYTDGRNAPYSIYVGYEG